MRPGTTGAGQAPSRPRQPPPDHSYPGWARSRPIGARGAGIQAAGSVWVARDTRVATAIRKRRAIRGPAALFVRPQDMRPRVALFTALPALTDRFLGRSARPSADRRAADEDVRTGRWCMCTSPAGQRNQAPNPVDPLPPAPSARPPGRRRCCERTRLARRADQDLNLFRVESDLADDGDAGRAGGDRLPVCSPKEVGGDAPEGSPEAPVRG
jgi:hypothetical protein